MVTVYYQAIPLALPDDLALTAGLREGASVELTATSEGVLLRQSSVVHNDDLAALTSRAFTEANRAAWDNPEEDAAWAAWQ